jgi:hypothetical protein
VTLNGFLIHIWQKLRQNKHKQKNAEIGYLALSQKLYKLTLRNPTDAI